MANPDHLQILQQGVETWNEWRLEHGDIRPDLGGATLNGVNLDGVLLHDANLRMAHLNGPHLRMAHLNGTHLNRADLTRANLYGTYLTGADLRRADLTRADLSEANLDGAALTRADLRRADLTRADLTGANLNSANLTGANLSQVRLYETVFGDTTLTAVRSLDTCYHGGPSILDHRTLAKSGPLPLVFLRGCGLNDWEIEVTKLYDSRLTAGQVNDIFYRIYPLRTDPLIQFYSCFITDSSCEFSRENEN